MRNDQVKVEEHLTEAFSHLELEEFGFEYYINLVAQAMLKEICFEASRPGAPADQIGFYDNKQYDYCKILNFLQELRAIAKEHEQRQTNARRAAYAQDGR